MTVSSVFIEKIPVLEVKALRGSVDDGKEVCRLERGAADQSAVDVFHRKQIGGIVGFHAAAIKYLDLRGGSGMAGSQAAAQKSVNVLRHLRRGSLAGADRPDRLISDDQPDQVGIDQFVQHRFQLALYDHFSQS